MKNVKKWIKEHKRELVIGTGIVLVVGVTAGSALYYKNKLNNQVNVFHLEPGHFYANKDYNTIDFFVGSGKDMTHIWSFDLGEAQTMIAEFDDAWDVLWPQD